MRFSVRLSRVVNRPKFGTTKVQLGADKTEGATGAEHKACSFSEKINPPSKTAKTLYAIEPPFGTKFLISISYSDPDGGGVGREVERSGQIGSICS